MSRARNAGSDDRRSRGHNRRSGNLLEARCTHRRVWRNSEPANFLFGKSFAKSRHRCAVLVFPLWPTSFFFLLPSAFSLPPASTRVSTKTAEGRRSARPTTAGFQRPRSREKNKRRLPPAQPPPVVPRSYPASTLIVSASLVSFLSVAPSSSSVFWRVLALALSPRRLA